VSVVETLSLIRSLVANPRFLILKGEQRRSGWCSKALGYEIENNNYPVVSDDEFVAAVAAGQSFAVETGKPNNLFDVEFDIYVSESLGSEIAAQQWLAENLWRLERLETIVVESPRHGFHVWGIASSGVLDPRGKTLADWLWAVEEDMRIKPNTIHFQSVNGSDYAILPPSPNYHWLTKCRTIRRL